MTEARQVFQVKQTTNVNGRARTIEFIIDKGRLSVVGDTQHIVLQITEDNKKILAVSIDRETIVDLNQGTSYKFIIDIERSTSKSDTKLTATVVDYKGKDFWWFGTPEDSLNAYVREKSVYSLVSEFITDLLNFLSGNISVKAKQE